MPVLELCQYELLEDRGSLPLGSAIVIVIESAHNSVVGSACKIAGKL